MNKVEEVARAIAKSEGWDFPNDMTLPYAAGSRVGQAMAKARAAIEAMIEPDVTMIAAFWRQKNTGTQEIGARGGDRSDYAAWRAAITAALSEGSSEA